MGGAGAAGPGHALPPLGELWSTALGAAHAAAAPMLAAGVPATLAALLLTGAVCGVLWAIALTLRAFRQAFDARELLFDDGSGGGLRTRSSYQFHRRQGGPSGRWMTGYCGPNGELPMFPEDVHLQCSHWAETGGREYMEDRMAFAGQLQGHTGASFYAVYDGHGGALAAEFCKEHMHRYLMELGSLLHEAPARALKEAFVQTDLEFMRAVEGTERVDGTTALVSVVLGQKLYVANAGDSRAILVQRGARAVPLSRDHKPSLPDEMRRITDLGGKVIFWGRWRVEGILAVSRAIGDRHLKPYVTPEPEVCEWALTDRDCFLVLATDGIWDVLSNEAVAQLVTNASHDPKWAARRLCEQAFLHGSLDNMAAVVVDLREHAANEFHHYYHHREKHRATTTATTTTAAAGGEGGDGESGAVPAGALLAATAEEEVEEEGEGAFFDSRNGEGDDAGPSALSVAERRFRRNVTVCLRSPSSSAGGSGGGGGREEEEGGGEADQQGRVPLSLPASASSSTSSSPAPSPLVSPSKRGGGLAGLLKHRRHSKQQQQPIGGGKQGGSRGPSPKKSS